MKADWKWAAIALLAIALAASLQRGCHRKGDILVETVVVTDTIRGTDSVFFPVPYRVIETMTDTIYIDTAKVVSDYFAEKSYSLTFEDTALTAKADITVKRNSIELAKFDYEMLRHSTITTIEKTKEHRFLLALGGGLSYSIPNRKVGVELQAAAGIKRHTITAGFDLVNLTPRIGWQYTIYRH